VWQGVPVDDCLRVGAGAAAAASAQTCQQHALMFQLRS